jgi:RNA polymerase sigma-70 factor, ECF subfamily
MRPVQAATVSAHPAVLLRRVAQGDDPEAVRACIDRYKGLVWSLVRNKLTGAEAEDAVQEIFIDLWRSAGRFDEAQGSEAAFVATIARRRLIDRLRRNDRQPSLQALPEPDEAQLEGQAATAESAAEAALAARALKELAPQERRVVLLSVCHGLSHSEIAHSTKIPLGTVKTYVRRGLMRVRERLLGARPILEEAL